MDSKWKWPALKVARWAFKHGEFFDLYDVSYLLGIPVSDAGKVVLYLRSLRCVEKLAETRRCKPEPGRMARRRIFIKVLAIHQEPSGLVEKGIRRRRRSCSHQPGQ